MIYPCSCGKEFSTFTELEEHAIKEKHTYDLPEEMKAITRQEERDYRGLLREKVKRALTEGEKTE